MTDDSLSTPTDEVGEALATSTSEASLARTEQRSHEIEAQIAAAGSENTDLQLELAADALRVAAWRPRAPAIPAPCCRSSRRSASPAPRSCA